MTRILITGATGYLGQNLVAHFAQQKDTEIYALVRPISNISTIESMATNCVYDGSFARILKLFAKHSFDLVIHVASLATYETSAENIADLVEANLQLGTFLLQAMSIHGCQRLINTGSYSQHYQTEAYDPVSLYSAMKEAFEKIITYYTEAKKLKAITLKLTDLYGPNDPRKKLFQYLSDSTTADSPLEMTACEQTINLLYIDDAVNAYGKAAEQLFASSDAKGFHQSYFAASEESYTLKDVISLYASISKKPVNVLLGKKPYREREIMQPFIGECLPGWRANMTLNEGIKNTLMKTRG